jgi:hydrogenase-4 component E
MDSVLDGLLVVFMLLNLFALGTSRIRAMIQVVGLQGLLLGVMPLLVHEELGLLVVLISAATIALKGVIIPGMLRRALRELSIHREIEPMVSLTQSLILGAAGTALALAFAAHLTLAPGHSNSLLVPASLATVFTGMLILITRLKAITQVTGYLVLENGIFIFGLLLIEALPFLVELGVLLDLFVCVFVMGIIIHHINREFASVSTERLSALKE